MTQEEKARAYDEALERARALRQEAIDKGYAIDYVKDYEAIFPELAESEEERIRKELIEAFEVYDIESSWNLIPVKHILAWLEKQEEQKPADNPKWTELTWKDIVELEGIINNVHYEFRNGIGQESFGKEVLEKFREYKGDEYLDEKEQKPAEWSDTNELVFKDICKHLKEEGYNGWIVLLNALRNGEFQPKPEWSKEDEKILNELLDYCNTENATWYNWLKSLRPQAKKNDMITPNKEFFQWIYDRLVNVHKEDPNVDYMISFKKRIEESSWKPSEEQMEVDLEKEIEKYFKGWTETDEGIACHYQYVDLNTCHGIAHHFYELGQREMRHRITNPEYNAKVVERLKSEYPTIKEDQYEIH